MPGGLERLGQRLGGLGDSRVAVDDISEAVSCGGGVELLTAAS
jgi:hypothetical protein